MKKIFVPILFFMLIGCSNNNSTNSDIKKYTKSDITIENKAPIDIDTIFNLDQQNKTTDQIKNGEVTIDYSQNVVLDEVEDQVFASNTVILKYQDSKDETQEISTAVKIKDTSIPTIAIDNNTIITPQGKSISEDNLVNLFGLQANDNSDIALSFKDYGKINFNKSGTYKVIATATDQANNRGSLELSVIVGQQTAPIPNNQANSFAFPVTNDGTNTKMNITIPNTISSKYKITLGGRSGSNKSYSQIISLKNGNKKAKITIRRNMGIGFPNQKYQKYQRGIFGVHIFNEGFASVFTNSDKSDYSIMIDMSNLTMNELKQLAFAVADNTTF